MEVSQTAQELRTLNHVKLTEHDHLYMYVLGQRDVQFEKRAQLVLQPAMEVV